MRVKDAAQVAPIGTVLVDPGTAPARKPAPAQVAPHGTSWHVLQNKADPLPEGTTSVLGLRAAQKIEPIETATVDGVAYVRAQLDEIRRLKRESPEVRSVVVFDLDNTLFETRARTLQAMRAFDAAHGTSYFEGLGIDDMGKNGRHTAELAGFPEIAQKAEDFWKEWFWKGENFLCDHVMTKMAELAHEAHHAGAEVVYLTGRVDHASTLTQLVAAGLPDADAAHLVTKPAVGANTGKFKGVWLEELMSAPDTFVGWFLTEGRRDIATVQSYDGRIPCVRLGYVHEREGHANLPHTPIIPESWSEPRHPIPTKS